MSAWRLWFVLGGLASASLASADALESPVSDVLQLSPFLKKLGEVTDFRFLPDGSVLLIEKSGELRWVGTGGQRVLSAKLPVDDNSEKGGLGLLLHPDFARNRTFFVYYSLADKAGGTDEDRHRVSSFVLGADGRVDLGSEKVLVRGLKGPANHDGGGLELGPDGMLYIGVGDTGCNSGRPPGGKITNTYATCLTNGNGKILRVRLDGSIPEDNPLVGKQVTACGDDCGSPVSSGKTAPAREDIWAWGLRNPWRFWFDPRTGKLWVADVGEVTYEEITLVEKGKHHGWPLREAAAGRPAGECDKITPGSGPCVDPIYACKHGGGTRQMDGRCASITGGAVVDACHWPEAQRGRYFFGDNSNGTLWSVAVNASRDGVLPRSRQTVGHIRSGIPVTMRLGPDGDLYLAAMPGSILKISPRNPAPCPRAVAPGAQDAGMFAPAGTPTR